MYEVREVIREGEGKGDIETEGWGRANNCSHYHLKVKKNTSTLIVCRAMG